MIGIVIMILMLIIDIIRWEFHGKTKNQSLAISMVGSVTNCSLIKMAVIRRYYVVGQDKDEDNE